MPTCPHCRQTIGGQHGTVILCPHCGGRVRFFRPLPALRSIPPITPTRQKPHSRTVSSLGLQPIRRTESSDSERIKKFEYKPPARGVKKVGRPATMDKFPYQSRQSFGEFGEIDESSKTIIFNLPLAEDQFSWKIEEDILKIKSLRLDFQYEEETKIPLDWEGQPKVVFLNGVLSFSWEKE